MILAQLFLPSFTPGFYEEFDGKDLGDVLEFKTELKLGFDIFENSKMVIVTVIFQIMTGEPKQVQQSIDNFSKSFG